MRHVETHTPGPWTWRRTPYSGDLDKSRELVGGNGVIVIDADPSGGEYGEAIDPESDDARLIAAAPDLLAVARDAEALAISLISEGNTAFIRVVAFLQARLRTTIDRAEGRDAAATT